MLKVLQLIPTLDRSGAEKQMVLLARGLPRERFAVEVAALTRLGPLAEDLREAGVPLTLIGKRHKADPFALRKLVRFLRDKKFDIVQTWLFAANAYGRLAALYAKVPVVIATEMAVDLWKGKSELAIDRWLGHRADCVVGNSNAVVEFYQRVGVPARRLEMIYSGIAEAKSDEFDPLATRVEFGVPPDAPLAIYIGRLAAQKGVDDLINALDLLQHVLPALRTWIVGDGPLRMQLEDQAHAYWLDEKVRFLRHRDDVPRLLAAADLLVLPSYYEGLPNVVLEAMQMGKPVVATAAPGTTEVVVDGRTGRLVPMKNPPALAEILRNVITDRALCQSYGAAGQAHVAAQFRAEEMIGKFDALYEKLARAKGLPIE